MRGETRLRRRVRRIARSPRYLEPHDGASGAARPYLHGWTPKSENRGTPFAPIYTPKNPSGTRDQPAIPRSKS